MFFCTFQCEPKDPDSVHIKPCVSTDLQSTPNVWQTKASFCPTQKKQVDSQVQTKV